MTQLLGRRQPALDVLRGAAIALVLVGHSGIGYAAPVGVTLFFVLSGFLITRLLIEERAKSGRTDLRRFYRHRIARLGPALLLMAAVVGVAAFVNQDRATLVGIVSALAYVANLVRALGIDVGPAMGHMWSLAVEEQFYLVWPLVFMALWPKLGRKVAWVLIALAVLSIVLRFAIPPVGPAEFRPELRADALLLGCLLAVVSWVPGRAVAIASAVIIGVLSLATWSEPDAALGYTLAALASVPLVAWAASTGWAGERFTARLGRISYGAYLWHLPVFVVVGSGLIGIAVTLLVAEASFRWLEEPLRVRLSRGPVGPSPDREVRLADKLALLPHE